MFLSKTRPSGTQPHAFLHGPQRNVSENKTFAKVLMERSPGAGRQSGNSRRYISVRNLFTCLSPSLCPCFSLHTDTHTHSTSSCQITQRTLFLNSVVCNTCVLDALSVVSSWLRGSASQVRAAPPGAYGAGGRGESRTHTVMAQNLILLHD